VSIAAESVLHQTVARIQPADAGVRQAGQEAFDAKAKPPGSLGRLEKLAGPLFQSSSGCELDRPSWRP
jgi:NaMN:DMB phosphoribosyltransferase